MEWEAGRPRGIGLVSFSASEVEIPLDMKTGKPGALGARDSQRLREAALLVSSPRHRGFGFVEFMEVDDAEAAPEQRPS